MRAFWELVTANIKDMLRDRMSLFWFLAFPLVFVLIFGVIFHGNPGNLRYSVGLVVERETPATMEMRKAFGAVGFFDLYTGSRKEELTALRTGRRTLVVVVPYPSSMPDGHGLIDVLLYYDPSNAAAAQALISSAKEILMEVERRMAGSPRLFAPRILAAQTDKLTNLDYLLPGILAISVSMLGLMGALDFVRLREQKILRRLGATPVRRNLVLWSGILARLFMSLLQMGSIVLLGRLLFGFNIVGNLLAVIGLILFGTLVFTSIGFFLLSFARTVNSAQGIIQVIQVPMIVFSGIFFPLEITYKALPYSLRNIVEVVPLSYFGDAMRYVMVGLPTFFGLSRDIIVLTGWLLVSGILSVKLFRWE